MSCVAFVSDLGLRDFYVAQIKGYFLKECPQIPMIDVTHDIDKYSIEQAAYVLENVFEDMPDGTVFLIGVKSVVPDNEAAIVVIQYLDKYIVCTDNGILKCLSFIHKAQVHRVVLTSMGTFPEKEFLAPLVVKILKEGNAAVEGEPLLDLIQKHHGIRYVDNTMLGRVEYIDDFGNLHTNISKEIFEKFVQNRPFRMTFRRNHHPVINKSYEEVTPGDMVLLFNHKGFLEVSLQYDNAQRLLGSGLQRDSKSQYSDAKSTISIIVQ